MARNNIKYTILLSVIILFFTSGQLLAQSAEWKKIAENVNKDQDQALLDTAEMEQYVKMDKAALEKELANLKARTQKSRRSIAGLKKSMRHCAPRRPSIKRILKMKEKRSRQ